jgi:hypothetical protein
VPAGPGSGGHWSSHSPAAACGTASGHTELQHFSKGERGGNRGIKEGETQAKEEGLEEKGRWETDQSDWQ